MMRLLWASPLPPIRSGVSDYAVEILPALARRARVRVVVPPELDGSRTERAALDELVEGGDGALSLVSGAAAPEPGEIQLVHLGNNPYHEWLIPRLELAPTVAVVHDVVLHHLLVESTLARGRFEDYSRLLELACGSSGRALARARRWGLTGKRDPFLFPATGAFIRAASGVLVHSRWAADELTRLVPGKLVKAVRLAAVDPGVVDRRQERSKLGIGPHEIALMHLGFMTREKGLLEILAGVAAALRLGVALRLVLVGEGRLSETVRQAVQKLGLGEHVIQTGWVESERMRRLPAAADLGVVIRRPSAGETSASALRFLACGTPVAIVGLRQLLEWPEAAAPRLTPGPGLVAELVRLLLEARNLTGWSERRQAARAAYEAGHRPDDAAAQMIDALTGMAA